MGFLFTDQFKPFTFLIICSSSKRLFQNFCNLKSVNCKVCPVLAKFATKSLALRLVIFQKSFFSVSDPYTKYM